MASAPVRPPRLAPLPDPALVMKKLMFGLFWESAAFGMARIKISTEQAGSTLHMLQFSLFVLAVSVSMPDFARRRYHVIASAGFGTFDGGRRRRDSPH